MKASSHLTLGLLVGTAAASYFQLPMKETLITVGVASVASVLPDIDHVGSFISRRAGLLALPFRLFEHRGFTHSAVALLLLDLLLLAANVPTPYGFAFVLAYSSHLLADGITPQGIRWFYPLRWRVRLLPRALCIDTGSWGEHLVSTMLFLLWLVFLTKTVGTFISASGW